MSIVAFLDMDGVLADFDNAVPPEQRGAKDPPAMFVPGFFRDLKPMPGAKEAVEILMAQPNLQVYVGSKPTTKATTSATEKYDWIEEHFPALLKRIVLVCDKSLLRGDVLVDDDAEAWAGKFVGEFIHFDRERPRESWESATRRLQWLAADAWSSKRALPLHRPAVRLETPLVFDREPKLEVPLKEGA